MSSHFCFDAENRKPSKLPRPCGVPPPQLAADNIGTVPEAYYQPALFMIDDCRQYLEDTFKALANSQSKATAAELSKRVKTALSSLGSLQRFLNDLTPTSDLFFAGETLERTVNEHFSCVRSLDTIFQIAEASDCMEPGCQESSTGAVVNTWLKVQK